MFYQSSYILTICIASLFALHLFRTKGNAMYLLGWLSFVFGYHAEIQSSLVSANNSEMLLLGTVLNGFVCSILFFYHKRMDQSSRRFIYGYQNKTKGYVSYAISIGNVIKWIGSDSKWCVNLAKRRENDSISIGMGSRFIGIQSRSIGMGSRYRENGLRCCVNFRKWMRKQVSKARNNIASRRNIIFWLSFIISSFSSCLRLYANRLNLYLPKTNRNEIRLTDAHLNQCGFKIIIDNIWLNCDDRSPPLFKYANRDWIQGFKKIECCQSC